MYADETVGTLPTTSKTNYVFGGWKDEDDDVIYTSATTPTKNVTLVAQWVDVDKVARINQIYYPSVQSAIDDAVDGD